MKEVIIRCLVRDEEVEEAVKELSLTARHIGIYRHEVIDYPEVSVVSNGIVSQVKENRCQHFSKPYKDEGTNIIIPKRQCIKEPHEMGNHLYGRLK